jgi:mannan endo-1,4-beta-mannosidase
MQNLQIQFTRLGSNTCKSVRKVFYPFLFALALILSLSSYSLYSQGFTISGNQLRDANGNNFIMKGINVPLAWFVTDVNNNIVNIRNRTGSNTLRIVVTTGTSDASWQTAVERTIANKMIPMVELHDVTGSNDPAALQRMASWWASKASFLRRQDIARYILVNIANEWGDWNMSSPNHSPSQTVWRDAYINAVATLRNAGINTTIVVDAPGYGQDNRASTLLNYAPAVQAADPRKNILFSVHMYCEWRVNGNSTITTHLPAIKNAGIPIIVGEFGFQHSEGSGTCDINETQIINTAQANGIGWLAWSWKGNGSGVEYLDLSNDWAGTSLTSWGNTVVNGSNGTKTAVTASVFGTTSGCGTASNGFPICCNAGSDPDGDGWGWENNQSCVVQSGGGASIANGTYRITPRHSGKSLDVASNSSADGANVQQWTYSGGGNQRWIIQSLGSGVYSIRAQHSGKSLDVDANSTADNANIQQWYYSGGNNQRWRIESVGSGYYRIVSVNSGKCIDIAAASTADGANATQYTCNGNTNQSFSLQLLSSATARMAEAEESDNEILVYPNPSQGSFTIRHPGKFEYLIKDKVGNTVDEGKGSNSASTSNNLAPGIYIIQIKSSLGTRELKLIKE